MDTIKQLPTKQKRENKIEIIHPYFPVEETLFQYKTSLKKQSLSYFICRDLCPVHITLRQSPQSKPEIQHCETYFRSESNPFTKYVNDNKLRSYDENDAKVKKVKKEHGWHAHIGNYKNYMHELDQNSFDPLSSKISTSNGDASLYNLLIKHKNAICHHISVHTGGTKYIKIGHYFEYGCLMVHILEKSCFNKATHEDLKKFNAWVNIIISYFTALVDFHCYQKGLPIELERRGGFGSITPTIAETGISFRISVGFVPIVFANILIECLKILDEALKDIKQQALPLKRKETFYASEEHLQYLEKKLFRVGLYKNKNRKLYNILWNIENDELVLYYKKGEQNNIVEIEDPSELLAKRKGSKKEIIELKAPAAPIEKNIDELYQEDPEYIDEIIPDWIPSIDNNGVQIYNVTNWFDFLWTPVGKDGSILLEHLTKTSYARHVITQELFHQFIKDYGVNHKVSTNEQFYKTIKILSKDLIINNKKLSLRQQIPINTNVEIISKPVKIDDDDFWQIVAHLIKVLGNMSITEDIEVAASCLKYYYETKTIDDKFYATFEALSELIFISAITHSTDVGEEYGDGYGSDSEEEIKTPPIADSLKPGKIFAKKLITHNGMRAIVLAILSVAQDGDKVWMDKAYYEIPLGIDILNTLEELNITVVKNRLKANIILMDANPCITNPEIVNMVNEPFEIKEGAKIIIIDITSASIEQCKQYIEKFKDSRSPIMIFVESGAKHQQFFTKNQYGVIRIFTKKKDGLENYYNALKKFNEPILSKTSHKLRRLMKELGMTFTNKAIIHTPYKVCTN